jgi:hypothetical protein
LLSDDECPEGYCVVSKEHLKTLDDKITLLINRIMNVGNQIELEELQRLLQEEQNGN